MRIGKYLCAYTTALQKQPFELEYIDAFAGTGYRTPNLDDSQEEFLFPELAEEEAVRFIEGSARIALRTKPRFARFVFVEKKGERIKDLEALKEEFRELAGAIDVRNADANTYLQEICRKDWRGHRAVLFLDPYGMQVVWETFEAIAGTKAIDVWILFPLGVAVNRLLKRDGNINESIRKRLDAMFGTQEWYNEFYKECSSNDLFGSHTIVKKVGNFQTIGAYFVKRLKTVFPGVAENPLPLRNSRGNPLYLLCFAAANERGSKIAIRMAQNILKG